MSLVAVESAAIIALQQFPSPFLPTSADDGCVFAAVSASVTRVHLTPAAPATSPLVPSLAAALWQLCAMLPAALLGSAPRALTHALCRFALSAACMLQSEFLRRCQLVADVASELQRGPLAAGSLHDALVGDTSPLLLALPARQSRVAVLAEALFRAGVLSYPRLVVCETVASVPGGPDSHPRRLLLQVCPILDASLDEAAKRDLLLQRASLLYGSGPAGRRRWHAAETSVAEQWSANVATLLGLSSAPELPAATVSLELTEDTLPGLFALFQASSPVVAADVGAWLVSALATARPALTAGQWATVQAILETVGDVQALLTTACVLALAQSLPPSSLLWTLERHLGILLASTDLGGQALALLAELVPSWTSLHLKHAACGALLYTELTRCHAGAPKTASRKVSPQKPTPVDLPVATIAALQNALVSVLSVGGSQVASGEWDNLREAVTAVPKPVVRCLVTRELRVCLVDAETSLGGLRFFVSESGILPLAFFLSDLLIPVLASLAQQPTAIADRLLQLLVGFSLCVFCLFIHSWFVRSFF
jgi:hypothetical protein